MEQAIRNFIKLYGKTAFDAELQRVLKSCVEPEFPACGDVERSAFPAEIQRMLAEDTERTSRPVPDLVHHGGHYLVKNTGEIIFVSAPCLLNLEITESVNEFCREHGWTYEVLPAPEPRAPEMPLRVVFRTGVFVSPA